MDKRPLYATTMSQFLAQSAAADKHMLEIIKEAEADGYVQVLPGIWEKRDADGNLIATMEF